MCSRNPQTLSHPTRVHNASLKRLIEHLCTSSLTMTSASSCLSLSLYLFITKSFVLISSLRVTILLFSKISKFWNCVRSALESSLADSWSISAVCLCIFLSKEVIWRSMSESLTENDIRAPKAELCGAWRCEKVRNDIYGNTPLESDVLYMKYNAY